MTFMLTPKGFDAFARALENPPSPNEHLRLLMHPVVKLWDDTVRESVPDDLLKLVDKLQ